MQKNITLEHIYLHSKEIFHRLRWGTSIACPECGSCHVYNPGPGRLHICADCDNRFSDTSNTIFHSTKLPLSKWLAAIYYFLQTSRGVSSYTLAKLVSVSQPTAWSMLMKLRSSLHHDIQVHDTVILDEIYLGADWKKKPYSDKIKKIQPPPAFWNLQGDDLKSYYKKQIYAAASADKVCVLGISAYNERSLMLLPITTPNRSSFVKSLKNKYYDDVSTFVTDESYIYRSLEEDIPNHEVCNHAAHIYTSPNHYSSNRLEGVFSHLRRMVRGTYQWWSKKYYQNYLNEFSWKWTHSKLPIMRRMEMLFENVDGRGVLNFS